MKLTKVAHPAGAPPPEPEHLPCPRCESTNTKFCYYNNYNFSQPRHFCKGCRRYWTHGGTLRDIPVGGGTRKRHRPSSAADPPPVSAVSPPVVFGRDVVNVSGSGNINNNNNNSIKHGFNYGSFTSLLGSNGPVFNGFGPGFVNPMWPFQMGCNGPVMGDTWQMQSGGEGGYMGLGVGGGECYTLPELAISTPGYCLK